MALDIDTDEVRRASEFVTNAGEFLHPDVDTDVPACGSDDVSQAVMNNLNARRRWLVAHVRTGITQASNAAAGMNDTANAFEAQDAEGAAGYGGGGSGAAPAPTTATMPAAPAPNGMPTLTAIPDASGADGETLAQQLETGPGAGPAIIAASNLITLSTRARAANASLTMAQGHIVASGQSQAHPGLMRRLNQAITWTAGVAGHADALAEGYGVAGELHTTTSAAVGPAQGWRVLKTAYADAVMENQLTGGLSQPKVDALQTALTTKETEKGTAMNGYQVGGQTVSTPPGDLSDPGLDPNADSAGDKLGKGDKAKNPLAAAEDGKSGGLQEMLGPLMSALGPLTQSMGQANPLSQVGQMAQQLGQQVSKLGGDAVKKAASPLKPTALAKPAGLGKGGGGGKGKGGGGSPIKPSNPLGGVRASSLSGAPSASPSTGEPTKPAAAAGPRAAGPGGGGGMGMMPMGHRPGGDDKAGRIHSYEDPLAEVEEAGRPGVVGEKQTAPAPVVNPEAQNAVKERISRRKRDAAVES
ncbi:Fis family transcriptional regulator [Mycolicibacterium fortuitum]|uniref:Fis family transcriptional regulator n=1 Tax=Mycolicibacterium fortuitum TaxID=1766 RepID=UPI003AAEBC8F